MLFLRHCDIMTVFIYKQLSKTLQGIRIEVYSIAIAISAFRNIDPSTGKQRHRKCRNLQLTAQREQWGDQRRTVCLNKRNSTRYFEGEWIFLRYIPNYLKFNLKAIFTLMYHSLVSEVWMQTLSNLKKMQDLFFYNKEGNSWLKYSTSYVSFLGKQQIILSLSTRELC